MLFLVASFVVVAAASVLYVRSQAASDAKTSALHEAERQARSAAAEVTRGLQELGTGVEQGAVSPGIAALFGQTGSCTLTFVPPGVFGDGHLDVLRPDGGQVCSSAGSRDAKRYQGAAWLAAATRIPVVALVADPIIGRNAAVSAAPIGHQGVIAAFVDLAQLSSALGSRLAIDPGTEVLITTSDVVISRSIDNARWAGARVNGTAFAMPSGPVEQTDLDGVERLYGEADVPAVGWHALVGIDKTAVLASTSSLVWRDIGIIGAGLGVSLLGALLIHRRLSQPLRELRAGVRDESERRHAAEAALHESELNYRQLFADNPHPMWVYDAETYRFLNVNDAAILKYGWSRDEFLKMTILEIRPPSELERLHANLAQERSAPLENSGPWTHTTRSGRLIDVEISSHVQDYSGQRAVFVLARDVTTRLATEERLRHYAFHDPLTGVGNYSLFALTVEEALRRGDPTGGRCAVILLDIDGLEHVNATVGREAGDQVLGIVARHVEGALPSGTIARVGGDEFAVVLAGSADVARAEQTARRLSESLRKPTSVGERIVVISATFGVAVDEIGVDASAMLRHAGAALAAAKSRRRGTVEVFGSATHRSSLDRVALAADLRSAVTSGDFTLVYQPQFDLRSGQLVAVEALARWQHATRGAIAPALFIPLAEELGLIATLDGWALRTACGQARAWLEAGLPSMRVAVNVSGRELSEGSDLIARVQSATTSNDLRRGSLEIELTETAVASSPHSIEMLGQVRTLGVEIAVDDFGTGYSSLDRLRDLPIDRVKVDRSFVNRITTGGDSLVASILHLAHSVGLSVVAEGVEREEEIEFLRDNGCDFAQGFWFSPPVTPEELSRMLERTQSDP